MSDVSLKMLSAKPISVENIDDILDEDEEETVDANAIDDGITVNDPPPVRIISFKKREEKETLLNILALLDECRLSLEDSSQQGYLINASATIASFIRNNY